MERHAELRGDRREVGVVRHDQRDLARELAGAVAEQEVVQAVVVARHEDRDALHVGRVRDPVGHREARGDLAEAVLERDPIGRHRRQIEADALEEHLRDRIGVLIGVEDVGAVAVQHLRQRRDDALAIGAAHQQRRDVR